jgi:hypothetical protein
MQKDDNDWQIVASDPFRMSGVYWALTVLALMGSPLSQFQNEQQIVNWVLACYKESEGSFSPNTYHDGNLLSTLSAVQIFALLGHLDKLDRSKIASCVQPLICTAFHTLCVILVALPLAFDQSRKGLERFRRTEVPFQIGMKKAGIWIVRQSQELILLCIVGHAACKHLRIPCSDPCIRDLCGLLSRGCLGHNC